MNVDHIKPPSPRWDLRLDRRNLQTACASCNWGKGGAGLSFVTLNFNSVQNIERAIAELTPQQTGRAFMHGSTGIAPRIRTRPPPASLSKAIGLFGSPADAALLDEVVRMAYRERVRPDEPDTVL